MIQHVCILSILVSNIFHRPRAHYFHTPISLLSSWNENSKVFKIRPSDWVKKRWDTNWS